MFKSIKFFRRIFLRIRVQVSDLSRRPLVSYKTKCNALICDERARLTKDQNRPCHENY